MNRIGDFLQAGSYAAQLRDERWTGFARLLRYERGNCCECCKRGNVPTQAHHLFYNPSIPPWAHDKADLVILCHGCHQELHEQLKKFRRYVFRHMRPEQFQVLNGALAVGLTQHDPLEFVHAVAEMAASPSSVKRFAYAWNGGKQP